MWNSKRALSILTGCIIAQLSVLNIANAGDEFCVEFVTRGLLETSNSIRSVAVVDEIAYLTMGTDGMMAVDVHDPDQPIQIGSLQTNQFMSQFVASGSVAYVVGDAQLTIIDISDPMNMTILSEFTTSAQGRRVNVTGGIAYVLEHLQGLDIINVQDPENPVLLAHLAPDAVSEYHDISIDVERGVGYVAAGTGIDVLDLSDLTMPVRIGRYNHPGFSTFVKITHDGTMAYSCQRDHTPFSVIYELDVSVPTKPIDTGRIIGGLIFGVPTQLIIDNGILRYSSELRSLGVIDILNDAPGDRHHEEYPLQGYQGTGIAMVGDRAYLTGSVFSDLYGLRIVDVNFECLAPCAADLNGDGILDFFDVSIFVTAIASDDPLADLNGDGVFNIFDVSAFLSAFSAGCP